MAAASRDEGLLRPRTLSHSAGPAQSEHKIIDSYQRKKLESLPRYFCMAPHKSKVH